MDEIPFAGRRVFFQVRSGDRSKTPIRGTTPSLHSASMPWTVVSRFQPGDENRIGLVGTPASGGIGQHPEEMLVRDAPVHLVELPGQMY